MEEPKKRSDSISANGVTLGQGSIVIADALATLEVCNISAALALESFGANLSIVHPGAAKFKPHPGHLHVSERLRKMLAGSYLFRQGANQEYLRSTYHFDAFPSARHFIRSRASSPKITRNRNEFRLG